MIDGQGNTKVQVWTGAMYQDITQRFKGDINKLNLPGKFQDIVNSIDEPGMKFDVKQHLAHKWNNTVGARVEFTRNFNVLTEFGFNNRNTFFVSGNSVFNVAFGNYPKAGLAQPFYYFPAKADLLPDRQQIDGWLNDLGGKIALMKVKLSIGAYYRGHFIPRNGRWYWYCAGWFISNR